MKAIVYYLNIANEPFYTKVNAQGWDGPIGKAYSDARYRGDYWKAAVLGILEVAAVVEAKNAEDVWMKLQNGATAWSDALDINCRTEFPRSMDVGDVIQWENGMVQVCEAVGFKTINYAAWEDMLKKAQEVRDLLEEVKDVA